MSKIIKCELCGQLSDSPMEKISGKNYCQKCAIKRKEEVSANNSINEIINRVYNNEQSAMGFAFSQLKKLKLQYHYTPTGIANTLHYIFDLNEDASSISLEFGITGLILKNYSKAQSYYEKVKQLNQQSPEYIDNVLESPIREVHIDKEALRYQEQLDTKRMQNRIYGPEIDLDDIEDEDEVVECEEIEYF